jgi:hypothetical protein
MRRQSIEQLNAIARVTPARATGLSRRERLRRWAQILDKGAHRELKPLSLIEYYAERDRALLRGDDTPIAVALADPVLRAEGLRGDTLGHAQDFFGLSSADAHYLLCDCHYEGRMEGGTVAKRLRALADPNPIQRLWIRLCACP